jgi:hypothetical protein
MALGVGIGAGVMLANRRMNKPKKQESGEENGPASSARTGENTNEFEKIQEKDDQF